MKKRIAIAAAITANFALWAAVSLKIQWSPAKKCAA